ncbi:FAD-binding protein [Nocardioides sp. NBC_00368]|uniref:FAD-binding oxidoreductase n=1 Tax=Nocardioides sp. NBC_00368 TaxID=2976000 RepID=UPI002E1FBC00
MRPDGDDTTTIDTLRRLLPADILVTDPNIMAGYRTDRAPWAAAGRPAAVVRPRHTSQVQATVRACHDLLVPVVTRGAGTGLTGAANAVDGGIVLSTEHLDGIVEINATERYAVVGPGLTSDALRDEAARHRLWYPPDPASAEWSTIGGNVATNAGGLCCAKYGVTRDYVMALEFVDGRGRLHRAGRRTAKGVVGLDIAGLLVGSEGALGVITEATLRLRPLSTQARTVVAGFPSLRSAGCAVAAVRAAGLTPAALELLDHATLRAIDTWHRTGDLDAAVLIARIDTSAAAGEAEAAAVLARFDAAGATWSTRSSDPREAEELFGIRRLAYPSVERLGDVLTEDICVPVSTLADVLEAVRLVAERREVTIATIAHAGDGNLHPLIVTERGDHAAADRARAAFDELIDLALAHGGTISGEHGVGRLKRGGMRRELTPEVVALQEQIKSVFDPRGILNPGAML